MNADEVSIEKWHEDEKKWWNKYGHYMTYQWTLTPSLNKIIRIDLEQDYTKFLLKANGNLLDLGCGGGWLSLHFAARGMNVYGVDLSQEQINDANLLKKNRKLDNVDFECCDLIQWDSEKYKTTFDCVFVNAFLHHLPEAELEAIFNKIADVLKSGGKVYMYEPLSTPYNRKSVASQLFDFFGKSIMYLLLTILPRYLRLYNKRYVENLENGYQMCSPHEGPVDLEVIKRCCANSFEILEVRGWHLFSMGFAMQTMALKNWVRKIYEPMAGAFYWLDKIFFQIFEWSNFSRPDRFILCSIKLKRR